MFEVIATCVGMYGEVASTYNNIIAYVCAQRHCCPQVVLRNPVRDILYVYNDNTLEYAVSCSHIL